MAYLSWLAIALLGFVGGWLLVYYLTVEPIKMARALLMTAVPLVLALCRLRQWPHGQRHQLRHHL